MNIRLPTVESPEPKVKPRELLTELPQSGHFLLTLDNTAVEHIQKCPTSACNFLVHRRQAHAKNAALTFGGAIHEGLREYFAGADERSQDEAVSRYFLENPTATDEYRTLPMALEVLRHYRSRSVLPDYDLEILSDSVGPLIERPFEVPLGVIDNIRRPVRLPHWFEAKYVEAIHVAWSGRIDLAAVSNHEPRILDHKTTSIAGDQFTQSFQLSNQAQGYIWAARQLWPELDIKSFCLDAIYLKRGGTNGSDRSLMDRGPRGGPPALDFFRAYFDYSAERIEEWEANVMLIIEDFVHCLVRMEFPMFTNSCFGKYGQCQYFDSCSIDNKEVRLKFLYSEAFKDVFWSPLL